MVFSFSQNKNLKKEIENKDDKRQRGKDMRKWGRNKELVYTLKGSLRESKIVREREKKWYREQRSKSLTNELVWQNV